MCKRIFKFKLKLRSYWQNIKLSRYCPKFPIFTNFVIFQVYLQLLRSTASTLYILWKGHVRNTLFHFCQLPPVKVESLLFVYCVQWRFTHKHFSIGVVTSSVPKVLHNLQATNTLARLTLTAIFYVTHRNSFYYACYYLWHVVIKNRLKNSLPQAISCARQLTINNFKDKSVF